MGYIMRYLFGSSLIALSILVFNISSANAEEYYWEDPVSKVSMTVPDTWRMSHDQGSDDVLTFWAPGVNDRAVCRMRVRDDKRFVIYPQRYSAEIQRTNFSLDFWESYAAEFDNADLNEVKDNAGLGRGFAGYADISYTTSVGPKVEKRAIALVSLYNDRAYILECSAEKAAFSKWQNTFLSVAKSVDFRKIIHEYPAGNYRDFLSGGTVIIHNQKDVDLVFY